MIPRRTGRSSLWGCLGLDARALATAVLGVLLALPHLTARAAEHSEAEPPIAAVATVAVRLIMTNAGEPAVARTSAGFFVTPEGHVLTTYQAVGGSVTSDLAILANPVGVLPGKVDVVWTMPEADGPQAFQAWVLAANPERDVAVLSVIGVSRVPHLRIGDSENLVINQPVAAFGSPTTDAGARGPATLAPGRAGRIRELAPEEPAEGEAPWLACDAVTRPEGVGGPILDAEGFVVAIAESAPEEGQRMGMAVPIHLAWPVLESAGAAYALPLRLELGGPETFDVKGLRMQVVGDLLDVASERTRWMSLPDPEFVTLTIDRLVSPLGTGDMEQALLAGALGDGVWQPYDAQIPSATGTRPVPAGRARHFGSARALVGGVPSAIEYGIFALGQEKVVARYVGPIDLVAFNRGLIRSSLESIRPSPLLRNEVAEPISVSFEPEELGVEGAPAVRAPADWIREPLTGWLSPGLPPPDASVSWSPEDDFTVSFRCLWWRKAPAKAAKAAATAMTGRGAPRDESYAYVEPFLGTSWVTAGSFAEAGEGLLLRQVRVPREKMEFVDEIFKQWTDK